MFSMGMLVYVLMGVIQLKQITFSKAKENYFYAERIDGELLQVREPIKGKKYYEIAVISGGSSPGRLQAACGNGLYIEFLEKELKITNTKTGYWQKVNLIV